MIEQCELISYSRAKKIADRIVELLEPNCKVIHIAGSVRREKPLVKDIEIVCIPKRIQQPGLFDTGVWIVSPDFISTVKSISVQITKGKFDGRYMAAILKGGMKLDLFMPDAADYYRQLAIRTGSADFSKRIIAQGWVNKGWCGSDKGLRRISDCMALDDGGWKCIRDGELPPVWKSEEEFFTWLSIKWAEPKMRGL